MQNQAEDNKKNFKVLDEKINSEAEDIMKTFENKIETLANEMNILQANFSNTITRVENQSVTYFTDLIAKVDAQSAISQGRPPIS